MMKKLLALLLVLMLCPVFPALAEEPPLYLIVLRDENGADTPIASGVLFAMDDVLITSLPMGHVNGDVYAIGPGGEFHAGELVYLSRESTVGMLILDEGTGETPLTFGPGEGPLFCLGLRREGGTSIAPAGYVSGMKQGDLSCLLFTAEDALLPGSVLLDMEGRLAGVTVAAYGEGVNRCLAVDSEGVSMLYDQGQADAENSRSMWVTDFTAQVKDGRINVDWSGCDLSGMAENAGFRVFFSAACNTYYTSVQLGAEERSLSLPAIPGESCEIWVLCCTEADQPNPALNWDAVRVATVPDAQPFGRYAYRDSAFYLGALPAARAIGDMDIVPPLENITGEVLNGPGSTLYVQAVSQYPALDQRMSADMLFVLTTPEGFVFFQEGTFIFDPALVLKDPWHADVSELFDDYLSLNGTGEAAPGEYTLSYYLDGALGSAFTFTLE